MLLPVSEKGRVGKIDIIDFGLLMEITKSMMNVGDLNHAEN